MDGAKHRFSESGGAAYTCRALDGGLSLALQRCPLRPRFVESTTPSVPALCQRASRTSTPRSAAAPRSSVAGGAAAGGLEGRR
jgi:hypothetical protein